MTSNSNDLVERLRSRADWGLSCADGSTCYQWDGGTLDSEAADEITRLKAALAERDAEIERLKDRMTDMMPIAGGNPMKHMGKSHGVAHATAKDQSNGR